MATATTDLELSRIIRDPDIQPREEMNIETVAQYAEDMLAGIEFPPAVVYEDDEGLWWLSQGFHRCAAADQAGFEVIPGEIRRGSREHAIWDAAGSNREHDTAGMRRSNADKRRAVDMALMVRPKLSDRGIAKQVGVGKTLVLTRRQVVLKTTSDDRRTGADGKSYPAKGNNGQSQPDDEPATEPDEEPEESEPDGESEEPEPDELFILADDVKPAAIPKFNLTNEMVDWARWTWNPATGCEHNCVYCYARDFANRIYPEKFEPTFRPERLPAPRHTSLPAEAVAETDPFRATAWRNVFVCSMADLFGRWVPDQWINDVFASCRKSPEWNYLFLTKFPQRYVGLDFPKTAWVGTSVDEQKRVAGAEKAFRKIKVPVKWLSVEPMRERIVFSDLRMFDWVVIGGQSQSSGAPEFHPEPWWVFDLACKAKEAGCKVYLKPNTFAGHGWQVKEYPY